MNSKLGFSRTSSFDASCLAPQSASIPRASLPSPVAESESFFFAKDGRRSSNLPVGRLNETGKSSLSKFKKGDEPRPSTLTESREV